jgi:hypothetical protein
MSRDLRQYARQTNVRLLVGFFLILFLVGDGLIYFIQGPGAALMGLICMLAGLTPLGLIGLALIIMDFIAKRAQDR